MLSKFSHERIVTLSIVVTLLTANLLVTVGTIGTAGAIGTASAVSSTDAPIPAVSDARTDTIDATGFDSDDAVNAPAAIGHAPAQTSERNRITFDHTEGPRASYEVTVSGSIEAGPEADLTDAESVDRIRGNRATGSVAEGGDDDYFFTGEITSLDVDGPITVYVNGERVDPDDIQATSATATPSPTTTTTTTPTSTETGTETSTASPSPTDTETETATETETTTTETTETETPTATETETPVSTTETATETATPSSTATQNASLTTTGAANSGSEGFTDQERGLFLTIGGVLLLGVLVIAGFVLFARQ